MSQIKLNFLSGKAYPQLTKKGVEVGSSLGHDLSIKYGKTFSQNTPKMINGLGPCIGIGIFSPTQKFLAHSAPEIDMNLGRIPQFIAESIYKMRESAKCKDDEISAVIYGGIAYDSENPVSHSSCQLVDEIEEGCRLEGIEPTIITGQYSDGLNTRINSYIGKNQITLWGKLIDKIKLGKESPLTEIQKTLENFFEYVKLPNNTKLETINELPAITERLCTK